MIFDFFRREIFEKSPLFPTAVGTFRFFSHPFSLLSFFGKREKVSIREKKLWLAFGNDARQLSDNYTNNFPQRRARTEKALFHFLCFFLREIARTCKQFRFTVSSKWSFCHKSQEEGKVKRCYFFYCFFDVPQHFL